MAKTEVMTSLTLGYVYKECMTLVSTEVIKSANRRLVCSASAELLYIDEKMVKYAGTSFKTPGNKH